MATINNEIYLDQRYGKLLPYNVKILNVTIDKNYSRTVYVYDIDSGLGHDLVYKSTDGAFLFEGECFNSFSPIQ